MAKKSRHTQLIVAVFVGAAIAFGAQSLWHADSENPFAFGVKAQEAKADCDLLDFRYLIVSNAKFAPKSRDISVFMDKKLFSKEKLTKLFARLALKYPDEKILSISVITDWEQFSDCSATGRGGGADQKPFDRSFLEARYYRDETREHFTYIPKPGMAFVKVDLKDKEKDR